MEEEEEVEEEEEEEEVEEEVKEEEEVEEEEEEEEEEEVEEEEEEEEEGSTLCNHTGQVQSKVSQWDTPGLIPPYSECVYVGGGEAGGLGGAEASVAGSPSYSQAPSLFSPT
ncbi:unnamed protein product [Gadus morhua 'NCC']